VAEISDDMLGAQLPLLTPSSDWRRPTELPDLRGKPIVALDTEEHDRGLAAERGPGWATGAGRVLGVSWAAEESVGYAPIAHPDSENFDKGQVSRWLRDLVKSGTRLVFQNAPYDLGWMHADLDVDVPPEYPIDDTLAAAFMFDENEYEYNLDAICRRLGLPGKDDTLLREAAATFLRPPGAPRSWQLTDKIVKANMHKIPARYVGPYAEIDAVRTLQAIGKLLPMLEQQNVTSAYRLEMDLVPTIRRMRSRGIRVDVEKAQRILRDFRRKRQEALEEIRRGLSSRIEVTIENLRSDKWLVEKFSNEKIKIPSTEKGNASFKDAWMEKHPHWLPKLVSRARQCDRFAETFIDEYVLGFTHRGRIHAEIHQYKSDDGGTVSYRFAYSAPPLQQAPSADIDPEFGLPFRECFQADGLWGANDYSQQEYRLTAHFAAACGVRGGAEAARMYAENPDLDFHKMVGDMANLPRARAKIQNFAILYGQGVAATAANLGMTIDEAKALRKQVEDKAPFGPALDEFVQQRAQSKGYIRLLDGARVRFDEWEAGWVSREEWRRGANEGLSMAPCSRDEAIRRRSDPKHPWRGAVLRRAGKRKALNRLIQGSAARQTKLAIRACAREGLIPILQMHDELDHDEDHPDKIDRVAEIMRDIVELRVPMKVDTGYGRNWAEAKGKDGVRPTVSRGRLVWPTKKEKKS